MLNNSFPSAFDPDMTINDHAIAPTTVSRLTAAVLGVLITEQVLKFDLQPGETLEYLDRALAEGINRALDSIDMPELQRALNSRAEARLAERRANTEAIKAEAETNRAKFASTTVDPTASSDSSAAE